MAIGSGAGSNSQKSNGIAIGNTAGATTQGVDGIAIGSRAGNSSQGTNAIAIGEQAGQANQHANTIVLNASGAALNTGQASSCYIKPIRSGVTGSLLHVNRTTNEVTFNALAGAGASTLANNVTPSQYDRSMSAASSGNYRISSTRYLPSGTGDRNGMPVAATNFAFFPMTVNMEAFGGADAQVVYIPSYFAPP